ncbi:MAG: serine/threonine-protein kinase [Polyangiales bacterium]|nr:serine/threonine protein kinase [Myxococcales bacterium]MCB9657075.1 serine/threonine protein kinase [Sandaracinaceae bacterium]
MTPPSSGEAPRPSPASLTSGALVGSVIKERYHLVRLIGDGGVGAVYKAADQLLRRFVAIKLLHPTTARKPEAVERFLREARAAAGIGHPNVTDVLDFGEERGQPFLVMEYLRGRSLSHAIAHDGRFSVERACAIATHSLAGLAAAHHRGILHRDLKPANLMLIAQFGDPDFVKVCDFGFATLIGPRSIDDARTLTPARTLVGTPAYAAPERLRGDDKPDPRMDVYSMGVALYEMLAGRRPFDGATFQELSHKVRHDPPPPLRYLRPDMPEVLERIVLKALGKEREDRWSSAEEFAEALVPFGGKQVLRADQPSDSFTMDLLRLRARETEHRDRVKRSDTGDWTQAPGGEARESSVSRGSDRMDTGAQAKSQSLEIDVSFDTAPGLGDADEGARQTERAPAPDVPLRDTHVDAVPVLVMRAFEGRMVLAVLRYVGDRFGQLALRDLLTYLPPLTRDLFAAGVAEHDMVPYDAVLELLERIDATMGRDDLHLVVECGREMADALAPQVSAELGSAPPELLITNFPKLAATRIRGVSFRVSRVGRGYAQLSLDEQGQSTLTGGVCTLGLLEKLLTHAGAEEAEVTMTQCRALGDDDTRFDLTWLG